jgi:predicted DNA-binding protein YlxM (UPF0122 family)
MARKRLISDEQKKDFIDDYMKTGNASKVAEKWSISYQTALAYLKRFGVDAAKKQLGEYHPKLGLWSDSRVARDMGVSEQAVGSARRLRGIESPMARALRIMEEG